MLTMKVILTILLVTLISSSNCVSFGQKQLKNVLFFAVDDLRTELGAYKHSEIISPNLDALAAKSILFERAYCQVAVCSPSRASLLTGRRPDTNHVWKIAADEYWRTVPDATNATTIPEYFKNNGYISIGMGKIFHPGAPSGNDDDKYSWSPEGLPYYHSPLQSKYGSNTTSSWWSFNEFKDNQLPDGEIADNAIQVLQQLKQNKSNGDSRPFFLAVGFHKPHLPFYAPSKYFDLYPPVDEIKLADNPDAPEGMPPIAYSVWRGERFKDLRAELANVTDNCKSVKIISDKNCSYSDKKAKELRRAYYSCISYTDAQIGRVIQELETQGYGEDTVIVLWADHGWQLGEHNIWSKFTNFEDATHVPFMIHVPGVTDSGMRTSALVELIDIFPSLTELAGIDVPPMCDQNSGKSIACVEGTSIVPLLKDPNREWKKGAFSQYPRPNSGLHEIPGHPPFVPSEHGENVMGYTVRVDKYRFTEWYKFDRTTSKPNFDQIWGTELYEHTNTESFFNDENVNLADKPEMKETVTEIRKILQAGWRAALPPT